MKIIILFMFWGLKLQVTKCQNFRSEGPSNFGYDASSACRKPYSRAARARFDSLPCDFQRQNWCTVPGNIYPWHAIRRFIRENQGLVKRMYGDEKYINVLRAEIDNNDVDDEFEEARNLDLDDEYEYQQEDEEQEDIEDFEGRSFTSRAFDESRSRSRFSRFPKLDEFQRNEFQPASPSKTTTISKPTTYLTVKKASGEEIPENSSAQQNASKVEKITTLAQIANIQNLSINEIPGQLDRVDIDLENITEIPDVAEFNTDRTTVETGGTTDIPTTIIVDRADVDIDDDDDPARNNQKDNSNNDQVFSASEHHFRPRPEYRPQQVKPDNTGGDMQSQLFQDVAAKDQVPPVIKLRGVNACPVKQEVVAPFWANNMRGEVFALLNLYPFEQYVHWEKCTDENKQMHCRDGCRCEQQYRFHRLLAYDPNNECRGIFSEWFKFPSCCVCRCYDVPIDLRGTSRSPRVSKPRRKINNQAPASASQRHEE